MRRKWNPQMPLMPPVLDYPQAKELDAINRIIKDTPCISDHVLKDLSKSKKSNDGRGARGMSADQVLRAAIVKILFGFSYKDLAFHLVDSQSIRGFCQIGFADKGFKKSVLHKNIKAISEQTWEVINRDLLGFAKDNEIEKGRQVRVDCTVVESNIHKPYDSTLLWDTVRVVTRLLDRAKEDFGVRQIIFTDHQRRAKRRMLGILKVTKRCVGYANTAIDLIEASGTTSISLLALVCSIRRYARLGAQVINQTERRVIKDEKVPVSEKIVSIFETHTDIIVKDRRDTYYGHKVCLTRGKSNLILDCVIAKGNPADTDLTEMMLDRQNNIYFRYPLKVAFDGGFASKENLEKAKSKDIKDVCFAKKRGLEEEDMCRSHYVYNRLRRFRAGIEAGISWLKRTFAFGGSIFYAFYFYSPFCL